MLYTTLYAKDYDLYNDFGLFHTAKEFSPGMRTPHFHDDYELYFLVKGNRKYFLANKICDLLPGDILLINHHEPHQAIHTTICPYERYIIHISTKAMNAICKEFKELADFIDTRFLKVDEKTFKKCMEIIDLLQEEFDKRDALSPAMIKNLVTHILLLLCRSENTPDHEIGLTEKNDIRLQTSINYIIDNYADPITLEQCARIAYMSPSHFSRLFHKLTTLSFKEYLNKIRIEKACELLKEQNVSITDLALNVGFNSSSYFSQVFKSLTGMSPITYRKINHKN
jgi:AraC-like DNA-binding protein